MASRNFQKANYHYVQEIGVYLPRVTSILNIIAKPQLVNWAAKTAAELALLHEEFEIEEQDGKLIIIKTNPKPSPEEIVARVFGIRNKAGDIGTRTHDIIDANHPSKLDPNKIETALQGRIFAYLAFLKTVGFKELIFSERLIWSKQHGYAGHADQGFITASDQVILVDYKTGSGLYDEVGLQLIAYEKALVELEVVSHIDQRIAVQLNEDGTMRMQDYNDPFEDFLHAFGLWRWKNKIK